MDAHGQPLVGWKVNELAQLLARRSVRRRVPVSGELVSGPLPSGAYGLRWHGSTIVELVHETGPGTRVELR